jgi:hypothetical protein
MISFFFISSAHESLICIINSLISAFLGRYYIASALIPSKISQVFYSCFCQFLETVESYSHSNCVKGDIFYPLRNLRYIHRVSFYWDVKNRLAYFMYYYFWVWFLKKIVVCLFYTKPVANEFSSNFLSIKLPELFFTFQIVCIIRCYLLLAPL